jgi:hypothetical protein
MNPAAPIPRLEVRYHESKELLACALCAHVFEPLPVVGILHDGDRMIGHLCPYCFLDPQDAAVRLQGRLEAERVPPQGLKNGSEELLGWERAQHHSDYWHDLAKRIEKLFAWHKIIGDNSR